MGLEDDVKGEVLGWNSEGTTVWNLQDEDTKAPIRPSLATHPRPKSIALRSLVIVRVHDAALTFLGSKADISASRANSMRWQGILHYSLSSRFCEWQAELCTERGNTVSDITIIVLCASGMKPTQWSVRHLIC